MLLNGNGLDEALTWEIWASGSAPALFTSVFAMGGDSLQVAALGNYVNLTQSLIADKHDAAHIQSVQWVFI